MEKKVIEISWVSLWRILFFVIFVMIMFLGSQILLGLFLAIVISSGLEVLIDFLENRGLPRTLGVILIFLLSVLLLIIIVYTIVPFIIADLNTLFSGLGKSASGVWWEPLLNLKASQSVSAIVNRLSREFFVGNISPLDALSQVLGSVGLAIAVIVSSFYLSLSRDGVERFIRTVFPADYEEAALRIYGRSRKKIGSWFRTQVLLSFVMGVLVWVALFFLGVKHAFLLGILAAIFEFVPFVGPILAGAAAVLAALTTSAALALYTLMVFLALHQFESQILVPLLTRRAVGLHPVVVIIALLIGAEVAGFLGIVIAVPAAAVFQEVLEEWSSKKRPQPAAA